MRQKSSEKRFASNGRGRAFVAGRWPRRASLSPPFKEIFLFSLPLLCLSLLNLSGCGYALVGTGSSALPATVKTVYVKQFVNDTTVVGLESRLTDAILRELSVRGRLKPVADRGVADAELTGNLTSCTVTPVRFDTNGIAVEYQVTVTGRFVLTEKATDKPIFAEPAYLFRQPYAVPSSASSYYDREREAIDAMARPFAQNLVTTILEGF
ncbi:MAG: LptE family protein [Acidobacteriota bacterium]